MATALPAIPAYPIAADCWADKCPSDSSTENFTGVRYKATLVENVLPNPRWMLLFNSTAFTSAGEWQAHFFDMMIKGGQMAWIYEDGLCPTVLHEVRNQFCFQFGLSDYEDPKQDNDIGMWSRDIKLFPRTFANIDSTQRKAPDKIMSDYQVNAGAALEGKEIEVSFERGDKMRLPRDINYFSDPDFRNLPCRQAGILFRQWLATFRVPSDGVESVVEAYVNASQAEFLRGNQVMNVLWENPGRVQVESDRFKVILYDFEVKTASGKWRPVQRFLVDYRAPKKEMPFDRKGRLLGGFRRVDFNGRPALEASFGYGYTDYVLDGDPTRYDKTSHTMGVIDLTSPAKSE